MKLETFEERKEAAAHADVIAAARALGIPLTRTGRGYVLRDYPDVIVTKKYWKSLSGRPGQAGFFNAGNAIHLAIEYADKGFRDAVEAVCAGLWPDKVPQRRMKEEDRVPFSRKVARIRIEKELEEGVTSAAIELPEATGRESDLQRCLKWFAGKGIDAAIIQPMLDRGLFYVRPRGNLFVFPSTSHSQSAEGTADGGWYISTCGAVTLKNLDGTGPVAAWFVPGRGRTLHVYQNPLDLLAFMERERRSGKLTGVPRLALFPGCPKALLHHVLQSGTQEAVLHLPEYSEDMLSAAELAETVKSYVRVRAEPLPARGILETLVTA